MPAQPGQQRALPCRVDCFCFSLRDGWLREAASPQGCMEQICCPASILLSGEQSHSWDQVTGSSTQAQVPDCLAGPGHPTCVTPLNPTNTSVPTVCQALSYSCCHLISRK